MGTHSVQISPRASIGELKKRVAHYYAKSPHVLRMFALEQEIEDSVLVGGMPF